MVISTRRNRPILGALALAAILSVSAIFSAVAILPVSYANGQLQSSATGGGTANPTHAVSANTGGLKFFIKRTSSNNTASANSGPTKKITINVHVQQGQNGKPSTLPITVVVPQNTKLSDLQLCGTVSSGQPVCQPLSSTSGAKSTLDLSKQGSTGATAASGNATSSSGASSAAPAVKRDSYYQHGSTAGGYDIYMNAVLLSSSSSAQPLIMGADSSGKASYYIPVQSSPSSSQGSLVGSVNIPVNIDVTAIVPININIQNAQICAQVGGGSCTQAILDPSQSTYSPTTVSYAQPTPTATSTPLTSSSSQPNSAISTPTPNTGTPSSSSPITSTPSTSSTTPPSSSSSGGSSGSSSSGGSSK